MSAPIAVVGAGGFGRETIDVIRAINAQGERPVWNLIGVLDDQPSEINRKRLQSLGVPILGGLDKLQELPAETLVAVGVGSPKPRERIVELLDTHGFAAPTLVHPASVIGSDFRCEDGAIICAHVSVGTNVTFGRHVHLNPHAVVGHDAVLRDWVSVNPNATVSGECELGSRVLVGAGAVILQGMDVGNDVTVGASACVVRDVPEGMTVKGVPAR